MYRACSLLDRSCFVYASCYWNVIYAAFVTQSGQKRLTDKCIPVVYEVDGDKPGCGPRKPLWNWERLEEFGVK